MTEFITRIEAAFTDRIGLLSNIIAVKSIPEFVTVNLDSDMKEAV